MDWSTLLENPQALLAYYPAGPRLEGATMHSLSFFRNGPRAELVIEPIEFPVSPSPRWPEASNKCQIGLRLEGVRSVELSRWGTGVVGDLEISRQDGVTLKFSGDATFKLQGSWLYVVSVHGYIDGAV